MPSLSVSVKHAGKTYADLPLDTSLPGLNFKQTVYEKTGVPVDRMKVMVKGGILKDDGDWAKISPKDGQTFMVIGAAGELPKAPEKKTIFVEDLDDADLAATEMPIGLTNLGNTCYMNATVQALRAVPELQVALDQSGPSLPTGLPRSLKDLYTAMQKTTDPIIPHTFLSALRQAHPQFAELDRRGGKADPFGMGGSNYAQQDAEECYIGILNDLREVKIKDSQQGFIEKYMMAEMRRELKSPEAPDEEPTVQLEKIVKLECNININTNYMSQGINSALTTTLDKHSPSLGRNATYNQTSRLTRLPAYLTVHMVRFAWRADVGPNGGKAKIMRRVKFPQIFDAVDVATDELKAKLLPVSRKLQEIEKEREERRKVRKRTKNLHSTAAARAAEIPIAGAVVEPVPEVVDTVDLGPEGTYRKKERDELEALVPEDVRADVGSSWSGVYELVAIVTHKGAAADAGHYIGFAKKSALKGLRPSSSADGDVEMADPSSSSSASAEIDINPNTNGGEDNGEELDEDWYKFDDQKVTVFPKEKLVQLEGGGEDSSAYVLIYRTKSF